MYVELKKCLLFLPLSANTVKALLLDERDFFRCADSETTNALTAVCHETSGIIVYTLQRLRFITKPLFTFTQTRDMGVFYLHVLGMCFANGSTTNKLYI